MAHKKHKKKMAKISAPVVVPADSYETLVASVTKKDILKSLIIILCLFLIQAAVFVAKGKSLL